MKNSINLFRNSLILVLLWPARLHAVAANGGEYDLTKCLIGESGVSQVTSVEYNAAYALGEDVAGTDSHDSEYDIVSGYFSGFASGYVGNFSLLGATVGHSKILQDGFQIGVPLDATIQLKFSAPLDPSTIAQGIQVNLLMDHLGNTQDALAPFTYSYAVIGTTVIISAQGAWLGNSLYDVVANDNFRSIDGFALNQPAHTQFITALDPHQDNVVLQPIPVSGGAQAQAGKNVPSLNLSIPTDSLSDYAYVLVSQDPVHSPLKVDPTILETATQKAQSSGGAYQTPLALQEIAAYSVEGRPMSLGKSIVFSIRYSGAQGPVTAGGAPIRSETLSLWALDETHALWMKMPDSRPNGGGVMGAVTQFSVYALMGSASGDASSVYAFPVPWRPHGPDSGSAPGQTGTESGGIMFGNLPSECDVKIFSLSGNLMRELHHSDLNGLIAQEKWDGNTTSGDHAASGVYFWRVASSADSKSGKLMIIR